MARLEFEGVPIDVFKVKINGAGKAAGELRSAVKMGEQVAFIVFGECEAVDIKTTKKDGVVRTGVVNAARAIAMSVDQAQDLIDELDEDEKAATGQDRLPGMSVKVTPPPSGPEVHVDGTNGTVLTPDEVAAQTGKTTPPVEDRPTPTIEEALAWWDEEIPAGYDSEGKARAYIDWDPGDVRAFVQAAPLAHVEYIEVLEHRWDTVDSDDIPPGMSSYEPDDAVLQACELRRKELGRADQIKAEAAAEAATSVSSTVADTDETGSDEDEGFRRPNLSLVPGGSPDVRAKGLTAEQVRTRLAEVTDYAWIEQQIKAEEAEKKPRKRLLGWLEERRSHLAAAGYGAAAR